MRDEFEKWWLSRGYNPRLLRREDEGYRDNTAQIAYFAYCKASLASSEGESSPQAAVPDAESLAIMFHDAYERLAPIVGYETRQETRSFNLESTNGKLMVLVCAEIRQALLSAGKGE
jgi:hypothetical protein